MSEPGQSPEAPAKRVRRSREELEALAKDFAATPDAASMGPKSWLVLGVFSLVVAGIVIWLLAPPDEPVHDRAAAEASAEDVAQWQRKLEARRERAKKMQGSGNYLERTAAAESAMLQDLTASAQRLADVADSPPPARAAGKRAAPAKEASAPAPEPSAAPASAPQKAESRPETVAAAAPERRNPATPAPGGSTPAPAPAPAAAPSTQVASAAPPASTAAEASDCRIHVSELSSSGKLTYADIARMKGAHVDEKTGHAFTPAIPLKGRTVVFDVAPNGCVTIARSSLNR